MTPLVKQIIEQGKADHVLNNRQLARLLGGSDERRYGQVNRAIKAGELIKVKRGIYVLDNQFRNESVHPFALAQQLVPSSYVSAESALSYHGWIPEAVRRVISITAKKKSVNYQHALLGKFEFRRMTVKSGYFFQSVARHKLQNQVALIADPVRALMDLVHLRKMHWQGLDYLIDGLRIEEQSIKSLPSLSFIMLFDVYKGKREQLFIKELTRSLGL
jgi:hypothetical protein